MSNASEGLSHHTTLMRQCDEGHPEVCFTATECPICTIVAPELSFCDNGHPGVSFVKGPHTTFNWPNSVVIPERCPVCSKADEVAEITTENAYLKTKVDEMKVEISDLRALAKKHRLL